MAAYYPKQQELPPSLLERERWSTLTLICIGVACLFGSQNIMSPNLTSMAEEFNFDQEERDRLLGAELSLAFSVYSIPGAMVLGLMADCCKRKSLFAWSVALGSVVTLSAAYVDTYRSLLLLRIIGGVATNAVVPIAFSFLGDLFSPEQRNTPATLVTAAMGVGILLGQVLAGLVGPWLGWRSPFVLVGLPGVFLAFFTVYYIVEPVRGQSENAIAEVLRNGGSYEKRLDVDSFMAMMKIRTNLILILQAVPGTIPWGVLFAYLNDFLAQEKGLSVESATLLVTLFGVGSAVGGIGGGLVGQMVYRRSKVLLPMVMGWCTILGVFPMLVLINADYTTTSTIFVIIPCTLLAGILANVNGTNVRPLLLNVNLPETRGAVVSVANLTSNLGRGVGPALANLLMKKYSGRQGAFNISICLWIMCGLSLFLLCFTLLEDEANVQEDLKRLAFNLSSTLPHHHAYNPTKVPTPHGDLVEDGDSDDSHSSGPDDDATVSLLAHNDALHFRSHHTAHDGNYYHPSSTITVPVGGGSSSSSTSHNSENSNSTDRVHSSTHHGVSSRVSHGSGCRTPSCGASPVASLSVGMPVVRVQPPGIFATGRLREE